MKRIILALAAIVAFAPVAQAHSGIVSTTPDKGAQVKTIDVIEMRFDGPMRVTAFTLTGPDGEMDVTRETSMEPEYEFRAVLPGLVPPGGYSVSWRGLSADGHPMQGAFDFVVID